MRWKRTTVFVAIVLLAVSAVGFARVPQQFFPPSDRAELVIDLNLPQNSSIYATQQVTAEFDRMLREDEDIDHWTTYIGRSAVHFYLPFLVELSNDYFGQALVVTKSLEARERVRARVENALKEKFPAIVARVYP